MILTCCINDVAVIFAVIDSAHCFMPRLQCGLDSAIDGETETVSARG